MEFIIRAIWTDTISSKDIDDFITAHRSTFGSKYSKATFVHKYIQNPYGPSLIVLAHDENGNMILSCHKADGGAAYTCKGTWSAELIRDCGSKITLLFTSTDHPLYAGKEYRVECVYQAYTESWMENDTLKTYLIMESSAGSSGLSPFEEVYGYDGAALHREQGPNMQVVKCSTFVSLREAHSKSSKRRARVPLGALVYVFLEEGEENGFIHCTYQDADGYILAEYLKPVKP